MNAVAQVPSAAPAATFVPLAAPAPGGAAPPAIPGLPSPLLDGLEPSDALGQMLAAIQRSGEATTTMTESQIQAAKNAVRQQLDQYLEQLRQAVEAAQKAKEDHDDGGLFGSIVDFVADAVGSVLGTILDFAWDSITLPVNVTADIVTHLGDTQAMLHSIGSEVAALGENGDVANSVKGFATGVIKFAADFAAFEAKLAGALASGLTGANVWDAVKDQAGQLWGSLKSNIIDNPQFWEVVGTVGKIAAVAGAIVSGGALGWVAVGLIALTELDKKTNFVEKAVGKDAAPWVKVGIGVATMIVTGAASLSGSLGTGFKADLASTVKTVQGMTAVVQGGGAVVQGVRTIENANDRANELERQADLQSTLNRMQQLNQLVSELLDTLGDQNDDKKTDRDLASGLVQTQTATQTAALMPA
jgi:hypothetical protein